MAESSKTKDEDSHLARALKMDNGDPPLSSATYKAQGEAVLRELVKRDSDLRADASKASHTLQGLNSLERNVEQITHDLKGLNMDTVSLREKVYNVVMAEYPCSIGKAVSKKERDETGKHQSTLVYGEITFNSFGIIFEKIKNEYGRPNVGSSGSKGVLQEPGGIFYDVGSGTGKPVFAAAALHPFKKACGIEILEGLHSTSVEILSKWKSEALPLLRKFQEEETEVEFILGDITDLISEDWTQGDILFANSTCFDDKLMGQLASLAAGMKEGSFFITLTKRLPSSHFKVLESEMYNMSWGGATVFIQQKVTPRDQNNNIASPASPDF